MKAFTIIKWGLGVFSIFASVLCFLYFYVAYWNVSQTKKWPQVTAVVEETTVKRVEGSKGIAYCPKSVVRFQFNNAFHTAELEISGLVCSRSAGSAQQAAGAWPTGKTIQIHANPENPTQVRLVGFALGIAEYLVLVVGCMCFLLVLSLRHLKSKSEAAQ